jgi:hypothetical protein
MNNLNISSLDLKLKNKLCEYIFHNSLYEDSVDHIIELENIFKTTSIELTRELLNLRNDWNNFLSLKNVEIVGNKSTIVNLKKQYLGKLVPIIYYLIANNINFRQFIQDL